MVGMATADFTASITFLPSGWNVRSGPIVGRALACAVVIDGSLYDVRFELTPGKSIALGATAELDGTFPDLAAVRDLLAVGKSFTLWDHGAIGHGVVVKLHGGA